MLPATIYSRSMETHIAREYANNFKAQFEENGYTRFPWDPLLTSDHTYTHAIFPVQGVLMKVGTWNLLNRKYLQHMLKTDEPINQLLHAHKMADNEDVVQRMRESVQLAFISLRLIEDKLDVLCLQEVSSTLAKQIIEKAESLGYGVDISYASLTPNSDGKVCVNPDNVETYIRGGFWDNCNLTLYHTKKMGTPVMRFCELGNKVVEHVEYASDSTVAKRAIVDKRDTTDAAANSSSPIKGSASLLTFCVQYTHEPDKTALINVMNVHYSWGAKTPLHQFLADLMTNWDIPPKYSKSLTIVAGDFNCGVRLPVTQKNHVNSFSDAQFLFALPEDSNRGRAHSHVQHRENVKSADQMLDRFDHILVMNGKDSGLEQNITM